MNGPHTTSKMCVFRWGMGCMGAGRDEGVVSTVSLNASISLSNPDIMSLLSTD